MRKITAALGVSALALGLGAVLPISNTNAVEVKTVCGAPSCDFATLSTAVAGVNAGDTIQLGENIETTTRVTINKELTIDLNGYNITGAERVLQIEDGITTLTGKGTIKSDDASVNQSVIRVGVKDKTAVSGTLGLKIGKDIKIESAGYGVSIDGATPMIIDINGTIKTGSSAFWVLGNTKAANVINVGSTAVLESTDPEVTAFGGVGQGTYNFADGAQVTGVGSALAIKSGTWNINGGTFKATGALVENPAPYGNGINPSGAAIQIESNAGYPGGIQLNINGGNFISANGYAIQEYTDTEGQTYVSDIAITSGSFESEKGIKTSEALAEKAEAGEVAGISGGSFSFALPAELIAEGVDVTQNPDGTFSVASPVAPEEEAEESKVPTAPNSGVVTATSAVASMGLISTIASLAIFAGIVRLVSKRS